MPVMHNSMTALVDNLASNGSTTSSAANDIGALILQQHQQQQRESQLLAAVSGSSHGHSSTSGPILHSEVSRSSQLNPPSNLMESPGSMVVNSPKLSTASNPMVSGSTLGHLGSSPAPARPMPAGIGGGGTPVPGLPRGPPAPPRPGALVLVKGGSSLATTAFLEGTPNGCDDPRAATVAGIIVQRNKSAAGSRAEKPPSPSLPRKRARIHNERRIGSTANPAPFAPQPTSTGSQQVGVAVGSRICDMLSPSALASAYFSPISSATTANHQRTTTGSVSSHAGTPATLSLECRETLAPMSPVHPNGHVTTGGVSESGVDADSAWRRDPPRDHGDSTSTATRCRTPTPPQLPVATVHPSLGSGTPVLTVATGPNSSSSKNFASTGARASCTTTAAGCVGALSVSGSLGPISIAAVVLGSGIRHKAKHSWHLLVEFYPLTLSLGCPC